jgi:hypothetical protein
MKKIINITSTLFFTLVLSGCGKDFEYDKTYRLHGKTIVFNTNMVYSTNLSNSVVNKEDRKYNRYLMRESESNYLADNHYKSGKKELLKIKNGMRFLVVNSYMIKPWGLQTAFSSEHRQLVLKDEDNLESLILEIQVKNDEILEQ